jgi:hypothetical protein
MWQPTVRQQVIDRSRSGNQLGLEALLVLEVPVRRFASGAKDPAQEKPPAPEKPRRTWRGKCP